MRDRRYFEDRFLENRVKKLERLMYERSVGRSGPSIAMNIWTFLMDHGPSTKEEIDAGLGARYSNNPALNSWVRAGLITKRGDRYVADPNYVWDDVGVINRSVPPELLRDIENIPEDEVEEAPAEVTRGGRGRTPRQPRQPREPRVRQVKQNLFSRKLEEVKAAVDAGQDPTAANDKGKSPLMFACGDPKGASGEIISYLLDHGANANDVDGNRPVLSACCKFGDSVGVKALVAKGANINARWKRMLPVDIAMTEGNIFDDALIDLTDFRVISNDRPLIGELSKAVSSGKLNEDIYSRIIHKAFDNNRDYVYISSGEVIYELKRGLQVLFDYYTETLKMVPPLDSYDVDYLDRNQLRLYYNAYVRASNGELKIKDMYNYLYTANSICKTLNCSNEFIYNFVTPEYVIGLQKESNGKRQLNTLISSAISSGKSKVLQTISKARPKTCNYDDIIQSCAYRSDWSRHDKVSLETTKAACRILNSCLPNKARLSSYTIDALRRSTNKYLLAYIVDRGYGKSIVDGLRSLDGGALSAECHDAIAEGDVEFKPFDEFNDDDRKKREEDDRRLYFLRHIINDIAEDEWDRDNERYVTEHPDILLDDSIQDAIEQNPDSFTARQLKRRIDQLPKDVYDM